MAVLEENKDGIWILTINRPEALNAINAEVMESLDVFFSKHKDDFSLKGVIITGQGEKAFVAGADIKQFANLDQFSGECLSKYGQDVFFKIEQFHAPVIALVNGFALGGGCELAMACHMRIATPNAKFGQPEVNLGLVPGYGATQRLVHLIGKSRAMELLLTADTIDATTALQYGLVNYVVEPSEGLNKSFEIINKISSKGPLAIQKIIQCVNACNDEAINGFVSEHQAFGETLASGDGKEGATAFIEKRKPQFKGI
jgi:enoyl-CoA hydratase